MLLGAIGIPLSHFAEWLLVHDTEQTNTRSGWQHERSLWWYQGLMLGSACDSVSTKVSAFMHAIGLCAVSDNI
jgi:hypothetical protein